MRIDRSGWLASQSPAFRLLVATSWLAPEDWRSKQEEAIRGALDSSPDWNEYLKLVDRHRTPVLSWTALKAIPDLGLPDAARHILERGCAEARMQSLRLLTLLMGVLTAFQRANISILVLKGPLLSQQMYGDFGMRQSRDLDIACKLEDLPRACQCLQNAGWLRDAFEASLTRKQIERYLRYEHHANFTHPTSGCCLELHWGDEYESADQIQNWWLHSSPAEWQGCAYRVMRPDDLAIYLCMHGSHHAWVRLKWLGDLARFQTLGKISWDECIEAADCEKRKRVLLTSRELLYIFYGLNPGQAEQHRHIPRLLVDWPLNVIARPGIEDRLSDVLPSHRHLRLISQNENWLVAIKRYSYCRLDYMEVPLSDRFFWLYLPLRPILWIARRIRSAVHSPTGHRSQIVDRRELA